MNRNEIFVFRPLSSGLGLERSHDLRHAPGLWSGASLRAAQVAKTKISRLVPTVPRQSAVSNSKVPAPLMMWQRFVAVWCDAMVCGVVALFALMCAGLFSALLDQGSEGPRGLGHVISSFSWLRQAIQILIALNNIATSLPWLPVLGFAVLFGIYRLAVALSAGASPGEALARWLVGPVRS